MIIHSVFLANGFGILSQPTLIENKHQSKTAAILDKPQVHRCSCHNHNSLLSWNEIRLRWPPDGLLELSANRHEESNEAKNGNLVHCFVNLMSKRSDFKAALHKIPSPHK